MPLEPDNEPNKYDKMVTNYKQIRHKIKKMDDAYIDTTNNKQLFKEIRDIFIDMGRILKITNGIQRDDDVV